MHKRYTSTRGFTVVELLVVIAVVAILALITVFAFGNWRERTATTHVKSALVSLSGSLEDYLNFNNEYPVSVPSTYDSTSEVTITYTRGTTTTYCAQGQSTSVTSVMFVITNASKDPQAGTC